MKKEFKAPIIELKQLSTANSIMDLAPSGDMGSKYSSNILNDSDVSNDFKQWKGFSN